MNTYYITPFKFFIHIIDNKENIIKEKIIMSCINRKKLQLIQEFQLLWNQHAEWTRMAINAIVLELPNEDEDVNRLLQNPVDFAIALEPYYGPEKSEEFEELLTEHLQLAAQMIKAMMAGNTVEAERIAVLWYENGNMIAGFLGDINPCWSYEKWKEMFFMHLHYVTDLAITMINEQFEENVETYDVFELEALEMGDYMSHGIIKQFPKKFC